MQEANAREKAGGNGVSVRTENLTRKFGDFIAVDNVTISVGAGEIFGFLGPNGAGKTTVIRMLCGLLKPTSGAATVAGFDVYADTERIKQNIGYMSQKFSLYDDLEVRENIEFYAGIYGLAPARIEEKRREILRRFGLEAHAQMLTSSLPLGFKQRLALGCAMMHEPRILFLDEPTSGVDPRARREFWETIHDTAHRGTTVFVTTHFMEEAEYCHRVSIMDSGRLIAVDTPGHLKATHGKDSIQDVFVLLVRRGVR